MREKEGERERERERQRVKRARKGRDRLSGAHLTRERKKHVCVCEPAANLGGCGTLPR